MTQAITYVVFPPRSSLLNIIDVADANGWTEAQRFQRAERQLEEVIYELPDGETVVRGIDDHFVMVVFAAITGPKSAEAQKQLRCSGDSLDESTLWDWATTGSPQERGFAFRAFAAISDRDFGQIRWPRIRSIEPLPRGGRRLDGETQPAVAAL